MTPGPAEVVPAPDTAGSPVATRRLVGLLACTTFVQWIGASAVLPLLPLYLRQNGGSDAVVGAAMAAFFVAGLVVQYPAGRVADRVGRLPVLIAGLLLYAVSSLAFVLHPGAVADIALRFGQGAGAAAVSVCAFAVITAAVPLAERGRAVGTVWGAQLAGLGVGPLLGSLAGVAHMNVVFVASAVSAAAACLPVLAIGRDHLEHAPAGTPGRASLLRYRSLVGALVSSAAVGLVIGVYEACWTLLLHHRGAVDWQIGLSWTMFAVPIAVMARPGGWLADHLDRRVLVIASLLSSIAFCCAYPFIPFLPALLVLGAVEAVGFAAMLPAAQSLLTEAVPVTEQGRAQGLFGTSQTGAVAVSAALGGVLFSVAPWVPFVTTGLAALALTATLPAVWAPVRGRVDHRSDEPAGAPAGAS